MTQPNNTPEVERCRCGHPKSDHRSGDDCMGDHDFCVCPLFVAFERPVDIVQQRCENDSQEVRYDRKGRVIGGEPPTECEHVGAEPDYFTYHPSGVRLCWECVSEFVSWMLDGGMLDGPDVWLWALSSDDIGTPKEQP